MLENYDGLKKKSEDTIHNDQVLEKQELLKAEGHVSPPALVMTRIPTWKHIVNDKGEVNLTAYDWLLNILFTSRLSFIAIMLVLLIFCFTEQ